MWYCVFLLSSFFSTSETMYQVAVAPVNYDTIYAPDIASVKCHIRGLPLSMPVIQLTSTSALDIYFDDLLASDHRYRYEIVHVDRTWHRDDLAEMEYLEGFNRSEIRNRTYSTNRNVDYTHYRFTIPNNDIKLTKSGNYLLHVYEEVKRGERTYIFTRRILVSDPKVLISHMVSRANGSDHYRTHQEVDFEINSKGTTIYNANQEIRASVMQNGNWSTLISDIKHNREKPDMLVYDFTDKVSFAAGKQFRYFDIRSVDMRLRSVKKITENTDETIITLENDKTRIQSNYMSYVDINGSYVIDNFRIAGFNIVGNRKLEDSVRLIYSQQLLAVDNASSRSNANNSSEYVWVDFTLLHDEMPGLQVYVVGQMTDWQCKNHFMMKYDPITKAYLGSALLKQGFYNYQYAVKDIKSSEVTTSILEGDWSETENEYQILVYYRPFGARYDQLIGFQTARF